jgi:hypothetical protein
MSTGGGANTLATLLLLRECSRRRAGAVRVRQCRSVGSSGVPLTLAESASESVTTKRPSGAGSCAGLPKHGRREGPQRGQRRLARAAARRRGGREAGNVRSLPARLLLVLAFGIAIGPRAAGRHALAQRLLRSALALAHRGRVRRARLPHLRDNALKDVEARVQARVIVRERAVDRLRVPERTQQHRALRVVRGIARLERARELVRAVRRARGERRSLGTGSGRSMTGRVRRKGTHMAEAKSTHRTQEKAMCGPSHRLDSFRTR